MATELSQDVATPLVHDSQVDETTADVPVVLGRGGREGGREGEEGREGGEGGREGGERGREGGEGGRKKRKGMTHTQGHLSLIVCGTNVDQ